VNDRRAEMYAQELGQDALTRQQAARDFHACCGEHKTGPHNEACKHFVPDALPSVIEGQASLVW